MAEIIPRVEGGRAQVANVPSAVLPNVSMPTAQVGTAFESASRYSGTLSNVIDQLSNQIFGVASKFSEKAGLQFAAENGLTEEQLVAIAKGDVSSIQTGVGSDFNVFSAAVKKYRALEVSSYAEMEARNELLKLHARAEAGDDISASDVQAKVAAILKGPSESLTQIDPEASLKYRATVARFGGDVIKDIARLDAQKQIAKRAIVENTNYENTIKEFSLFFKNDLPINKNTNAPFEPGQIVDAMREDALNKALIAGGVGLAAKRTAGIQRDIDEALTGALTQRVLQDDVFKNPATRAALRANDQKALNTLLGTSGLAFWNYASDEVKAKVRQAFTLADNEAYQAKERAEREDKEKRRDFGNKRLIDYYNTEDPKKRREIAQEIAASGGFTNDELGKFLDPKAQDGDEYVFGDILHQVNIGALNDPGAIRSVARRAGMSGKQYTQLVRAFDERLLNKDEGDASKILRSAAGIPDVVTVRTQGDEAKFTKFNVLSDRYRAAKDNLLRQGKPFDPRELALSIVGGYNDADRSDINKNAARESITNIAAQVNEERKRQNKAAVVIDENTNVDDLVEKKIIDKDTAAAIRKKQGIINKVDR